MMRKSDILAILALGEIVAWFLYVVLQSIAGSFVANVGNQFAQYSIFNSIVDYPLFYFLLLSLVVPPVALTALFVASLVSKRIPIVFQGSKFIAVGVANTAVDFGILNFLILIFAVAGGPLFSIFKGISFIVAVAHSYFWNKFWTFKKEGSASAPVEFVQFLVVSAVGFALNVGVASLLVVLVGPQFGLSSKIWANAGAAAGSIMAMAWNFFGYKFFVFKR